MNYGFLSINLSGGSFYFSFHIPCKRIGSYSREVLSISDSLIGLKILKSWVGGKRINDRGGVARFVSSASIDSIDSTASIAPTVRWL